MAAAAAASPSCTKPPIKIKPIIHRLNPSSSLRFFRPFSSSLPSPLSISHPHQSSPALFLLPITHKTLFKTLAVVEEEAAISAEHIEAQSNEEGNGGPTQKPKVTPCELYICNIPRSCDISELFEVFKPYGTVQSVEVSRNSETGVSRGCGFVTMSSFLEAKAAIAALDGSDIGGREMRIRFSGAVFPERKNVNDRNSAPKKTIIESPHKAYVGNLPWSLSREDLREHFSQFGSVVSSKVLYDRRGGRNRVYGFVSFSSAEELEAAISSNGTEFRGRTMLVRNIAKTEVVVPS
ncbi:hypothetical protein AAC387_Pa08g1681 [Persea americana]